MKKLLFFCLAALLLASCAKSSATPPLTLPAEAPDTERRGHDAPEDDKEGDSSLALRMTKRDGFHHSAEKE